MLFSQAIGENTWLSDSGKYDFHRASVLRRRAFVLLAGCVGRVALLRAAPMRLSCMSAGKRATYWDISLVNSKTNARADDFRVCRRPAALLKPILRSMRGVSAVERQAGDVPVEGEEGAVGGDHGAMAGQQCEADDIRAAQHDLRLALRRDPHNAALAAERRRNIEIAEPVERESLRAPQPAEKHFDFSRRVDSVDAIEARSGGPGDEQLSRRTERQMVRGDGRLERRENENLSVGPDLENRAAAVAHVEAAVPIERDSGRDAHAFDPLDRAAVGRNAMDRAVVAAGD